MFGEGAATPLAGDGADVHYVAGKMPVGFLDLGACVGIWAIGAGYCLLILATVVYVGWVIKRKRDEILRDSGEQADVAIQILR